MDQFKRIQTPENVIFGHELAGLGVRFVAALVDYTIISVLSITAWYGILNLLLRLEAGLADSLGNWALALTGLLLFIVQWGYYVLFEGWWNGQSPGKRLLRLRVVRTDGSTIQLEDAIVRNLVRVVDNLPFNYFVGLVAILLTSRMQRLGDLAAGTIVVKEGRAVRLEDLGRDSEPFRL